MKLRVYNQKRNMGFGTEDNAVPRVLCIYPELGKQEFINTCHGNIRDISIIPQKGQKVTFKAFPTE